MPPIIEERDHKLTSEPTFNQPLVWTSRHSRGTTGVPRAGPQASHESAKAPDRGIWAPYAPGVTSSGPIRVLLLNGGSSSGKSTIAGVLQETLDGYWLRMGVDTLIDAAPRRLTELDGGLALAQDGSIVVGEEFQRLERQWRAGVAAMARAGAGVIIEDNFLGGPASQQGWRESLGDVPMGWVGVRCSAEVAAARERARGDRTQGMAAKQADAVHVGVSYDLEVDTSAGSAEAAATAIRDHFFGQDD